MYSNWFNNRRRCYCFVLALLVVGCGEAVPEGKVKKEVVVVAEPAVVQAPERVIDYSKVPKLCLQYRELIEEHAGNPQRLAALMEQESSCKKFVVSFDNGEGLFQFTGATGPWLADTICRSLGPYQPFNPKWAIPCAVRYLESLTDGHTLKDIRVGEMRYNGGYWIIWEMKEAVINGLEPTLENALKFCGTRMSNGKKRAKKWCQWNYDYYKHIERRMPKYISYLRSSTTM